MFILRPLIVLVLLSFMLVSCGRPLIDIYIRTGADRTLPNDSSGPQPACGWPISVCPGVLLIGKVDEKKTEGSITVYDVRIGNESRLIHNPPDHVVGEVKKGFYVEITESTDGVFTIKRAE